MSRTQRRKAVRRSAEERERRPDYNRDNRIRAVSLYAAGWTIQEIADTMDRSYSTVQRWLTDMGIETRPPGRRPRKRARKR